MTWAIYYYCIILNNCSFLSDRVVVASCLFIFFILFCRESELELRFVHGQCKKPAYLQFPLGQGSGNVYCFIQYLCIKHYKMLVLTTFHPSYNHNYHFMQLCSSRKYPYSPLTPHVPAGKFQLSFILCF